ncbi:MAG: gfo/Idh/MocA family oxidoreductase [Bdellovibrio sp.]|nr:MAG: gfo/Idh/MocA family oxidoreductase [Bdellovibrio sp.]
MTSPLPCAVVGVGYLGRFHAQKYKILEEANLVGVCDINEEVGQKVAEELGVPYIKNPEDLLPLVKAVTIAATTSSHFELCKLFLENGVHVHVEKPMTTTVKEAEELCSLAEKKQLKFQVGHVERFNAALVAAREQLKEPLFMESHRLAPFKPRGVDVDVVLDLMIHDLDVILSLVSAPVKTVSAVGTPVLTSTTDIANARLEFESGAIANLTASRVSLNAQRKIRVFQKDQYLSIDFGKQEVSLLTKTDSVVKDLSSLPFRHDIWSLEKSDALLEETRAFVKSVLEDTPCVVSGRDGLVALKLARQIIECIQRRK